MTLIAALRCENGVVICADTQETVGSYRVSVDKIAPREVGEYELVIGGAGNSGGLIDDFTESFSRSVEGWPAKLSEQDIRLKIRRALFEFHRDTVNYYPAAPDDKLLEFIICIKGKMHNLMKANEFPGYFLWKTSGTSLVTVNDYKLLGFDDMRYEHEAKRLYFPQITMAQAVMLCINLFSMAKVTSNYIGLETQVITVRLYGMMLMRADDVRDLEQRTATFNQALAELVLACPDLSIHNDEFRDLLTNFEQRVMQLREQYFEIVATNYLDRMQDNHTPYSSEPFQTMPGGMVARGSDGKPELIPHDQVQAFLEMAARLPTTGEKGVTKKRGRQLKPKKSKGRQ